MRRVRTAHRTRHRHAAGAIIGAGLLALTAVGLAACGSDGPTSTTTAPRNAAGPPSADGVCQETTRTRTAAIRVVNLLPGTVTFRVPIDSVDCFDWSGVSTPYTAFNRKSVAAGTDVAVTLETARRSVVSQWTMSLHTVGSKGEADGTSRMYLQGVRPRAEGGKVVLTRNGQSCAFTRVAAAPPGWRDTSLANLDPEDAGTLTVGVVKGDVGYIVCDQSSEITDAVT